MGRRLANLNWVGLVLTPLMVVLMEVFWVYPWLAWVGKWQILVWQRPPLGLASLILLLGISVLVTRFLLSRRWRLPWIQLSVVASGLAAIFIVLRIEYGAGYGLLSGQWFADTAQALLDTFSHPHPIVIAPVAALYLWWRGIKWGRSSLHFNDIYGSFLFGLSALILLIIVWRVGPGTDSLESLTSTTGLHVAGFFFFGLTALALGHLQTIRQKMQRQETAPALSHQWLAIMLGVVGGIVLAGIGAASIFSAPFLSLLGRVLSLTSDLLGRALYYLFIPIGYLLEGLLYVGRFIISLLRGGRPAEPFQQPPFFQPGAVPQSAAGQTLSAEAILVIKWVLFAIICLAVIFLLARAVLRYWSLRAKPEIEEVHESLWSWEGFKADLRLFFSIIWQRLHRRKKEPLPVPTIPGWYTGDDIPRMLGIRDTYRHLLWEASRAGIARRGHETPYEYARRLGEAVPQGDQQVGELTDLYIDVRYGDLELEDRRVHHANSLWKVLRGLLRRSGEEQPPE